LNFNIRTNTIFENLNNQEVIHQEELHSDERYKLKIPMTNNIPIENQYKRTSIFEKKM
jgi:hypothetical protein